MKIAIKSIPENSGHKYRGSGVYADKLMHALESFFPEHKYTYFSNLEELDHTVDIVHYPFFEPFFLTLNRTKKFPFIVTVHDLIPLRFPTYFPSGLRGGIKWYMQRSILRQAAIVITDSESSRKDINKFAGIREDKIKVVYLAADEHFNNKRSINTNLELRKKYKLPEKFVLYVGDVTWNKNLVNLIEAIENINVPLVLAGKALTQNIIDEKNIWNQSLVKVNKIISERKQFIKLGFLPKDDLVRLYQSATVFTMPSFYEGFGLPILEAMQSGCPVVTSKNSSIPEIAGDAALYVNPYDVNDIASGIKKIFNNERLRSELRIKGIKQAGKFTWKNTAEGTIKIYEYVKKAF